MEMDISQYKDLFITEAQEHLDALNRFMLQLENEPQNLDVVTEIFRSAHTLKGMSATMGYDHLTELAHEMENLLEHLRTGDVPVTSMAIDTLFSCFDTLGTIVAAISEDQAEEIDYSSLVNEMHAVIEGAGCQEPSSTSRSLEACAPGDKAEAVPESSPEEGRTPVEKPAGAPHDEQAGGPETAEHPVPEEEAPRAEAPREEPGAAPAGPEAAPDEEQQAHEKVVVDEAVLQHEDKPTALAPLVLEESDREKYARVPGMRIVSLTVHLDEQCLLKSVRVFMVFKKLAQVGEVISSKPPVEQLEDEQFDTSFQVLFASTQSIEKIEKSLLAIAEIAAVSTETVHAPTEAPKGDPGLSVPRAQGEADIQSAVKKTQSVRVNIGRLDALMNLVGELVINRTRLSQIGAGIDLPELREALDQMARLTGELQDEVMKTRMVPVENVFNRFPRMVRDLSKAQGKEIEFIMEGKEIELDRTILDEISDPLIHMIRNAIDHGIDVPEKRAAQGKPERGIVKLHAYRDRNYVAIAVEDDGSGIDPERVFDKAIRKGIINEEDRKSLNESDILRILCTPGFSTSEVVSGVSGRGVGMDAVKAKADSLGGYLVIESEMGVGTTVSLKLPLTLAIVQALMVEVSRERYAIPLGTVRETHVINPEQIKTVQNNEAIFLRDETIPLLRLDRILGCKRQLNGTETFPVVITEIGPSLVALGVHSLQGQQEIVISSLDQYLKRVEGFAGATILGSGQVALILDIPSLM